MKYLKYKNYFNKSSEVKEQNKHSLLLFSITFSPYSLKSSSTFYLIFMLISKSSVYS